MKHMIANYHTHTWRCRHGDNVPDEAFVQHAIQGGFQILGFSDHTPWPYRADQYERNIRMEMNQLAEYVQSVRSLQKRYQDQLHIYIGLECEYYPAYFPWLESVKDQFDYLILGNHWPLTDEHGEKRFMRSTDPEDIDLYFQGCLEAMETGWFAYIAHPELVMASYPVFDHHCIDGSYALCRKAKELKMPLEYNLSGLEMKHTKGFPGLGYPCSAFWEIARDTGCQAIIGCDAHHLHQLSNDTYRKMAESYLSALGIEVLQTLPGLD